VTVLCLIEDSNQVLICCASAQWIRPDFRGK
jgi:hypothetical protein